MVQEKKCAKCGEIKPEVGGFTILDIGLKEDDVEFDDICRDCRKSEKRSGGAAKSASGKSEGSEQEEVSDEAKLHAVACSFASLVCGDLRVLEHFDAEKLYGTVEGSGEFDYEEILVATREVIYEGRGLGYPKMLTVGGGNYVVIGHASGCHAENGIISCVQNMCEHLNATPIHVGPILDAHGLHSSKLLKLPNLVVVADLSEIYEVSKLQKKYGFKMVRYGVEISGNTIVRNQYYRENPYTVGSTKGIMVKDEYDNVIMPRPLLELHAKTKAGRTQVIATCGCICAKHRQRKPPKRANAESVEQAITKFYDGTRTGRRQTDTVKNWKNGLIVVQASDCGRAACVPCEFHNGKDGYATGYYNTVVTERGIVTPDKFGLVVGDIHVPKHDPKALSVVENVAKLLKPDYLVNLGDHVNSSSLNHHKMDRGQPLFGEDFAMEYGMASRVLEIMSKWAPVLYIIFGNHERFVEDFIQKFPQLASLFDMRRLLRTEELGYEAYDEKSVLRVGNATFIHGEMRCYGATGDRNKKCADVFGEGVIAGHCHNPSARHGSYHIGLLGKLDQEYNEPQASNWMHGFATVCHYGNMVFPTIATIVDYRTFIGEEIVYASNDVSKWIPQNFTIRYSYEEEE